MALRTTAIRQALADVLEAADLRAYAYFAEAPQPPCAVVQFPTSITPAAFGDVWDYVFPVQVMVARVTDERSQDALDDLLSSVVDLIESADLSGVSVTITGIDGIGDLQVNGADLTVGVVTVLVRA